MLKCYYPLMPSFNVIIHLPVENNESIFKSFAGTAMDTLNSSFRSKATPRHHINIFIRKSLFVHAYISAT